MAGILAGLLIFTGVCHVLNVMYVDDNVWARCFWHHFYKNKGKIDNICVGSSHVYCDIDPSILDRLNGQYNFNLATSAQSLSTSYYLLREADSMNELSHVYLEMYYACQEDDEALFLSGFVGVDYMRPSINKMAFISETVEPDFYINILFPFRAYRKYLGDIDYVEKTLEKKRQEAFRTYQYEYVFSDGGRQNYEEQGFLRSTRILSDSNKKLYLPNSLSGYTMGEKTEGYCRKIIEYCQKREIPITLFVCPSNDFELIGTVDYDDYVTEIRMLASEYGVAFYDFNLAKEEYLPIQDEKYFADVKHLNQYGAEIFTPFFYQIVTGKETDNEKYFYDSYEDKIRELPPKVYGICFEESTEEKPMKTLRIISNRNAGMEYRISLTPEEWVKKKQYIVQDFNENMVFEVPPEERGICRIEARMKDAPDKVQIMEVLY